MIRRARCCRPSPGDGSGPSAAARVGMTRSPTIPLVRRFPALASVPRVELGRFPTPVQPLRELSPSLWIKRDDLCGNPLGRQQGARAGVSARRREARRTHRHRGIGRIDARARGRDVRQAHRRNRRRRTMAAGDEPGRRARRTASRARRAPRPAPTFRSPRRRVRVGVARATARRAMDRRGGKRAARCPGTRERRTRADRSDRRAACCRSRSTSSCRSAPAARWPDSRSPSRSRSATSP